jgi:4-aminobutyrate aminotransferase-like enzyme
VSEGMKNRNTRRVLDLLRAYESRNITFFEEDGSWPIVWARARGVHVWDADGKRYLDLTGAFGVAAAGHANPRVVRAGQRQMDTLLHAMGDVHPHEPKALLARELSRLTFERWTGGSKFRAKTIFCNSGFEAVEAALKTAMLATGKPGVICFTGAYHGLGYGALNATHRDHFRAPFRNQLRQFGHFVPFPQAKGSFPTLRQVAAKIGSLLSKKKIGAVLVEPVQVRGGINIPSPEFLPLLRRLCDDHSALLILDEVYTGFGRTGQWFACEHSGVIPDVICLGKGLTGGFPLSACVGRADVMDQAWPPSSGEAIHTSTFLGHPVGCVMALAQITEIRARKLVQASAREHQPLCKMLKALSCASGEITIHVRNLGLLAGIELRRDDGTPATDVALRIVKDLLHLGYIFLPEGEHSNVISFSPPLTISRAQLKSAVDALGNALKRL